MRRTINILLCLLALATALPLGAQEISFTATVDRNDIKVGERIKLVLSISNAQGSLTPPDLGGLVVVQGPFESSSFRSINGQMSMAMSRTYVITATKPGRYTIGPATAKVGGGTISTDPIVVTVSPGSTEGEGEARQGQGRNTDLFTTISLSRPQAYVGQQLVVTYHLYSRYNNIELAPEDIPAINGAWVEEVDIGERGWEDQLRTVNGIQYRVAVLKKQLIIPQKSGEITVGPMNVTCVVDRSFFNRGRQIEVKSNKAVLKVKELPKPIPADHSGAVGEFVLKVDPGRTELSENQATELVVRLSGSGNLKLMQAPKLELPKEFEVYDPDMIDNIRVNGSGMSGSREFKYTVIPRRRGTYEVPPITFTYFDAGSGSFRTLDSGPITYTVEAGSGTVQGGVPYTPPGTAPEILERDIRYIRSGDLDLAPRGSGFWSSPAYPMAMGLPLVLLGGLLLWQRRREAEAADVLGTRRKRADKVARQRLQEAEKAMTAGDQGRFHDALIKALQGYVMDRFGLSLMELDSEHLREHTGRMKDGNATIERYLALVAACEQARFAPVQEAPMQDLYTQAVNVIGEFEEA